MNARLEVMFLAVWVTPKSGVDFVIFLLLTDLIFYFCHEIKMGLFSGFDLTVNMWGKTALPRIFHFIGMKQEMFSLEVFICLIKVQGFESETSKQVKQFALASGQRLFVFQSNERCLVFEAEDRAMKAICDAKA